jgi:hypothetical protein
VDVLSANKKVLAGKALVFGAKSTPRHVQNLFACTYFSNAQTDPTYDFAQTVQLYVKLLTVYVKCAIIIVGEPYHNGGGT